MHGRLQEYMQKAKDMSRVERKAVLDERIVKNII